MEREHSVLQRLVCCRVTEAEELSRLIEGARYQLKLLPNKSLSLWLTFTPRKEAAYNFDLPITLLGYGFSVAGTHRYHCQRHTQPNMSLASGLIQQVELKACALVVIMHSMEAHVNPI